VKVIVRKLAKYFIEKEKIMCGWNKGKSKKKRAIRAPWNSHPGDYCPNCGKTGVRRCSENGGQELRACMSCGYIQNYKVR